MSAPLDHEACFIAVAKEQRGTGRAWLRWRGWRAEWQGRVERLRWEAEHWRELQLGTPPGIEPRRLESILLDLEGAVSMVEMLTDCAALVARPQPGRTK